MSEPSSIRDGLAKASSLIRSGRSKEAIPILDRIIEADPDSSLALTERIRPTFPLAERGRAKLFSTAIDAFPGLTNAYRHRAEARALAGDKKGADDDLVRYNELGGLDLPAYA